jgi:hypothetical protein
MVEWSFSGLLSIWEQELRHGRAKDTAPPQTFWGGTVNNYQSSTGKLAAQEEFLG